MSEFRRRLMMAVSGGGGPAPLPYDAQVEYIATNGTPYFNLQWDGNSSTDAYYIDFQATTAKTQARLIAKNSSNSAGQIYVNGSNQFGYRRGSGGWQAVAVTVGTTRHQCKFDFYAAKIEIDGSTYNMSTSGNTASATTMLLVGPYTSNNRFIGRVYACKIWRSGVLKADLIPVRIGTTGYLYDKERKIFLGNAASSGAFTYGQDIT